MIYALIIVLFEVPTGVWADRTTRRRLDPGRCSLGVVIVFGSCIIRCLFRYPSDDRIICLDAMASRYPCVGVCLYCRNDSVAIFGVHLNRTCRLVRSYDYPLIFTDMGHKPCLFLRLKTDERLYREVYNENNLDESIGEINSNQKYRQM